MKPADKPLIKFEERASNAPERIDLEGLLDSRPYQSGAGRAHGISDAESSERLYLVTGSKIYSGYRAFRMMLLFNPVTYFAMAALIAQAPRIPEHRAGSFGTVPPDSPDSSPP
jgi:hypothetical protein